MKKICNLLFWKVLYSIFFSFLFFSFVMHFKQCQNLYMNLEFPWKYVNLWQNFNEPWFLILWTGFLKFYTPCYILLQNRNVLHISGKGVGNTWHVERGKEEKIINVISFSISLQLNYRNNKNLTLITIITYNLISF